MENTNKFFFPTKTKIWWGSHTVNSSTIKDSEVTVDFAHKGFTVTLLPGVTPERNKAIYHTSKVNKQHQRKPASCPAIFLYNSVKRTVDACRIQIPWPGSPGIKPSYWFKFLSTSSQPPQKASWKHLQSESILWRLFLSTIRLITSHVSKTDHQQQILREGCQFWRKLTFYLNIVLPWSVDASNCILLDEILTLSLKDS